MKKIYLFISLVLVSEFLNAQTPVATSYTVNNFNGPNFGLTFNVLNSSTTNSIRLKKINSIHAQANTAVSPSNVQVWYRTTPVNQAGALAAITSTNGWTLAGTATLLGANVTSSAPTLWLDHLSIDIPPSSKYAIFVGTIDNWPGFQTISPATQIDTFTNGVVSLIAGANISFSMNYSGTPFNMPRGFVGSIEYVTLNSCTSPVTAGQIIGTTGFCGTQSKTYRISDASSQATGLTYQWLISSSPSGPWSGTGTNSPILNRTISATTYYRCAVTCSSASATDTTPVFADTANPFYLCYCSPIMATRGEDTKIDSVRFLGNVYHTPKTFCERYSDNRNLINPPKLRLNTNLTIDVMNGSCSSNHFASYGAVYLDLNRNGIFDASERIGNTWGPTLTLGHTYTRSIAIPSSTTTGITGMRIIHVEGAAAPTAACGTNPVSGTTYGEVEDYLIHVIQDPIDAQMNSLLNVNDKCSATTDSVKFNLTNIGSSTINPLTVNYSVNGGAVVTETFGSIASGTTQSFAFSTLADYTGLSNINLKVWHSNAQDTNLTNDTLVANFINYVTPDTPNVKNVVACKFDAATIAAGRAQVVLRAKSTSPFMTRWYSDAAGTNEINIGDEYTLMNPTTSQTFYVKSVNPTTGKVGLPVYPNGSGMPFVGFPGLNTPGLELNGVTATTVGIVFDVLRSKVTINSVKVKFTNGGNATIEIRNSAGTVLKTVQWAVGQPSVETIPINFSLPVGTGYRMVMASNPGVVCTWGYNTYPLTIPNVISLTNSINSFTVGTVTSPAYNAFYDWNVSYDACVSNLVPITLTYDSTVNAPSRDLRPRDTACSHPSHFINANSSSRNNGCSFLWQDNSTNQAMLTLNSGLYNVTITNARGCEILDTSRVHIYNSPFFTLGPDKIVCFGSPTVIKSGYTNRGFNHVWNTGSLEPEIEIIKSGKYWLDLTNTSVNCGFNDTIEITVVPLPYVFLGKDTFACNNTPVTIQAPTNTLYSFIWDDGSTASSRTLTASKKIWVEVQDASGAIACKNSDTINVTISTLKKPALGPDRDSCNSIRIGILDTPGKIYRWNTGENTSQVQKSSSGTYILTVSETGTSCTHSDTVVLTIGKNLPLSLGPDISTCEKKVIVRANKGFINYVWNPSSSTSDTIEITSTKTVYLSAASPCGVAKDTIQVNILDTIQKFSLPEDTFICQPLKLQVPTPQAGNKLLWSTGDSVNSFITVNETGHYWVRIGNDCSNYSDAIYVVKDTTPIADFDYSNKGTFVAFENKSEHAMKHYWTFGDLASSTDTKRNTSFVYDTIKTITVSLTVENSCGVKSTKSKTIDLSIDDNSGIHITNYSSIHVYPNPTSTNLFIKNMDKTMANTSLHIHSIDGKVVLLKDKIRLEKGHEFGVDVSSLNTGSYILIIDNDKTSFQTKISITK